MQPQDPVPPITPIGAPEPPATPLPPIDPSTIEHKKDSILAGPDPKQNPFGEHIARPKEVPLARPEYVHPDQAAPVVPDATTATQQAYDYITQSPKVVASPSKLTNSLPKRVAVVGVGLILLFIVFSAGKNLLVSGPKITEVVATVQRQQEILHVLTGALQETSLSASNKNFALTAQLAIGNSQGQLLAYIHGTGLKLKPEVLGQKLSVAVDKDLAASAANNAYNTTFAQTMQSQLTSYSNGLKQAYDQDTGAAGRKLLRDDYDQAQLLLRQLQSPQS